MRGSGKSGGNERYRIANEAARVMSEEGIRDFGLAKRKAAERLGESATRNLPTNQDIEAALRDYQRLFHGQAHADHVLALRREALTAMKFLEQFGPGLVGSVLRGTATRYSDINLHVFADTPEHVSLFLMDNGVPHETGMRRLRTGGNEYEEFPVCRFRAGDFGVELVVFPEQGQRQAPLSPIDGKPMRRGWYKTVASLIESGSDEVDAVS